MSRIINFNFLFIIGRTLVLAACLIAALHLENPSPERLGILLTLMTVLILWINLREIKFPRGLQFGLSNKTTKNQAKGGIYHNPGLWIPALFFLMDVGLLYVIEQNSRFILNYYLHLSYFVLLANAGVRLPRFQGLLVNSCAFIIAMSKFINLLAINNSPANFSAAMFSFFTALLTIVVISYAKSMREEKEVVDRLYKELKVYADRLKELTVAGERNRIAGEIHDSIGHNMIALIMRLEICGRTLEKDRLKAHQMLRNITAEARNVLADVRRAVDALRPRELEHKPLESALGELVEEFSRSCDIRINLKLNGGIQSLPPVAELALFRAVQEALTNSLRHGKATAVEINARVEGGGTVVEIADNAGRRTK